MSRILITGGAGFIGSQLANKLNLCGHTVTLIDNLSYGYLDNLLFNGKYLKNFIVKDIRDKDLVKLCENKDVVIHLAGISSLPECQTNPLEAYSVNVAGTANCLEASRQAGVKRFIFASTSAVYENSKSPKFKESLNVSPDLVYSTTKKFSEDICNSYSSNYGMDIIICRFFNVFGPHQDIHRESPPFTSYISKQLYKNEPIVVYNNTKYKRDYIYSEDLTSLLLKMIESKQQFKADIFNIGSGVGYSAKDIINMFIKVSKKNIIPKYEDPSLYWNKYNKLHEGLFKLNPDRIIKEVHKHSIADMYITKKTFNWKPTTHIIEGIREVYSHAEKVLKR